MQIIDDVTVQKHSSSVSPGSAQELFLESSRRTVHCVLSDRNILSTPTGYTHPSVYSSLGQKANTVFFYPQTPQSKLRTSTLQKTRSTSALPADEDGCAEENDFPCGTTSPLGECKIRRACNSAARFGCSAESKRTENDIFRITPKYIGFKVCCVVSDSHTTPTKRLH